MLDMRFIRENTDVVRKSLEARNSDYNLDELLSLDKERREILTEVEALKKERNEVSAIIGKNAREGKDSLELKEKMSKVSSKIKELDVKVAEIDEKQRLLLLTIPNVLHSSTPFGKDEDENVEVRKWGIPRKFDFEVKPHDELGVNLDILDFERGAKLAGSRFTIYKGLGARLERALINFMLDTHTSEHGFKEIFHHHAY